MNLRSQREIFSTLSLMVRTGTGLTRALELLAQGPDPAERQAAQQVLRALESGQTLEAAFTRAFGPLTGAMMGIAQQTGALAKVLENLAWRGDRSLRRQEEVKSALFYPLGVLSVSLLVGSAICFLLLPQLLPFVTGLGGVLPWPTRLLQAVYEWRWVWGNLLLLPASALLLMARTRPEWRARLGAWLREESPLVGPVLQQMALAQACEDLAGAVSAGVGLHQALELAAEACAFPHLAHSLNGLAQAIRRGEGTADFLASGPHHLGALVGGTLTLAEEVGRLPELLRCTSRLLEVEAEYRMRRLIDLLEPTVMAAVSVVVGFLALAGLLPIYQVISAPL